MKVLSLSELHACSLEILKDIDSFCRPRGIRYSLAFGSLLGAVRHKGFIPWDDDIDLVMPREDYDRFRKEYVSDTYSFIDRESCEDCYITFGRVVETRKTLLSGLQPWHSQKISSGVWIDIFPMDYVPDDHRMYMHLYRAMNLQLYILRKARRYNAGYCRGLTLKQRLRLTLRKLSVSMFKKMNPSDMALDMVETLRLATSAKTSHFGSLSCPDAPKYYFDVSLFDEYVDLPFEDGFFPAPAAYDTILCALFGDSYMELPPVEMRKTDMYKFENVYWL